MAQRWEIERVKGSYKYDKWSHHGTEVTQGIVLRRSSSQWRIKLTLYNSLSHCKLGDEFVGHIMRLASLLDFDRIHLLRDTVTELMFSALDHWEETIPSCAVPLTEPSLDVAAVCFPDARLYVREDPQRVRFPLYDGATVCVQEARLRHVLDRGLHLAIWLVETQLPGDEAPRRYIYKRIERPLYLPEDTELLAQELKNLETIGPAEFIIRLAAAVVSPNPYHTDTARPETADKVLRGFLIEYHPAGTLEDALSSPEAATRPWRRWAIQVGLALQRVHEAGITHMDVKPSNFVIDEEQNIVLIDICSLGSTWTWLAPEMFGVEKPYAEPFPARIQNDVWAYGKQLFMMAQRCPEGADKEALERVAAAATATPLREVVLDMAQRLKGGKRQKEREQGEILERIAATATTTHIARISLVDAISQLQQMGG